MSTDAKLPSHDREAERCVLGGCLRDNAAADDARVRPGDFYVFGHQRIFGAVLDLRAAGKPADLVTVADALHARGDLEDAGGAAYLMGLWDAAPSGSVASHADIVRGHAVYRALANVCREIARDVEGRAMPAEMLAADAQRRVYEVAAHGFRKEPVHIQVASAEAWAKFQDMLRRQQAGDYGSLRGLPTGLDDLDVLLCGLQPSQLYILAARPSVGKTAFALNVLHHVCVARKTPAFFASLEQPRVEVAERLYVIESGVDYQRYRHNLLDGHEVCRVEEAKALIEGSPLYVEDTPSQTLTQIAVNARRMKARERVALVCIDYLGLIRPEGEHGNRESEVSGISRGLKNLARDLELPVLCLAQLNRQPESRPDRKPRLSDLRDSGSLEQDADGVLFLWRPDEQQAVVHVVVAKQRNGPVGDVPAYFDRQCMRFTAWQEQVVA